MHGMDQDTAAELQQFLYGKNQKWFKVTTPGWTNPQEVMTLRVIY